MKKIFLATLTYLLYLSMSQAANVKIAVEPLEPLINETFNVIFTVESNTSEEPYISFNPGRAEVIGRNKLGSSVQTTIINGKISTKRMARYSYEMVTDRPGRLSLKNIKAEIDGSELKLKPFKIKILKKRRTPKELFIKAETSKEEFFVGEGFDINYYMYFRVNVVSKEVLAFPKLQKLLKRFINTENAKIETVEYDGVVYRRILVYSARAFSDRVGKVTIDPIKVRAQYQASRRSAYGLGGLSFGGYKAKTLRSKRLKLMIKPLPADNVPSDFSGLVGEHEFKLKINKTKFLVNEAIEATLEVSGEGALENYEAPRIYINENLEDFDTKAELTGLERGRPLKTFEYTILARGPVTIPAKELKISYFDPEENIYKTQSLNIPSIVVAGTALAGKSSQNQNSEPVVQTTSVQQKEKPEVVRGLLAPEFSATVAQVKTMWPLYFNGLLGIILLALITLQLLSMRSPATSNSYEEQFRAIKKDGLNYSNLYRLLNNLSGDKDVSLTNRLKNSKLSADSKHYFENLLLMAEQSQYKDNSKLAMNIKNKLFKELVIYLRRSNNGNN
jgi:hypothetical protein